MDESVEATTEETQEATAEPQADETSEQGSEETTENNTDEQTEEPVKSEEKLYKIKINGTEREMPMNEIIRLASKGVGADEKFQEAASVREQTVKLLEDLKGNTVETLDKLGVDFRKTAEDYLYDKLKEEAQVQEMNPEQKKAYELEQENKRLKDEAKSKEQKIQEAEIARKAEVYQKEYDMKISAELAKTSLPKTPKVVSEVARYLMDGRQQGIDIPIEDAVKLVQEDYINANKDLLKNIDPDKIDKILGEDLINKIRQLSLKTIKTPQEGNRVGKTSEGKPRKKSKGKSWDQIKEELDDLYGQPNYGDE